MSEFIRGHCGSVTIIVATVRENAATRAPSGACGGPSWSPVGCTSKSTRLGTYLPTGRARFPAD